jgi:hypothetical protein
MSVTFMFFLLHKRIERVVSCLRIIISFWFLFSFNIKFCNKNRKKHTHTHTAHNKTTYTNEWFNWDQVCYMKYILQIYKRNVCLCKWVFSKIYHLLLKWIIIVFSFEHLLSIFPTLILNILTKFSFDHQRAKMVEITIRLKYFSFCNSFDKKKILIAIF